MISLTLIATLIALIPLFSILWYVVVRGFSVLNFDFFTNLPKPVGEKGGGIANAIVGTLQLLLMASIIGVPIGILSGMYLSEYGNGAFSKTVRFVTDMLLGVPSIIVGIVVYVLLVVPMKGYSAIAGSIALAIIIIPAVTRTTEEMLKLIPGSIREAGLALGLPKWRVTLFVVLPSALQGIITGMMLAIARASGETAPLLFTALGNRFWNEGLTEPISSLPVQIFNYAIAPYKELKAQAWGTALTLIFVVLILNIVARILSRRRK